MIHQDEKFYYEITEKDYLWQSSEMKHILDLIREKASSEKTSVLEVGCGIAAIVSHLPQHNINYIGTDVSEFALERAHSIHGKKTNTEFLVANMESLPFGNDSFDFVLAFNVLEHTRQPKQSLDELRRVLKIGGTLVLAGPNLDFPLSLPNGVRHKSLIQRFGLRILRLGDYVLRIFGRLSFRTIPQNFTEFTNRYEKPDDDIRYYSSSYEVITYLARKNFKIDYTNKLPSLLGIKNKIKRVIMNLPGMRYYGRALFVIATKTLPRL